MTKPKRVQKTLDGLVKKSRPNPDESPNPEPTPEPQPPNPDPLISSTTSESDQIFPNDIGFAVGKNLTEEEKLFFVNCWQPTEQNQLPVSTHGGYTKRLLLSHLKEYKWLAVSRKQPGVFCKPCVLFHGHTKGVGGVARGAGQSGGKFVIRPLTKFHDVKGKNGEFTSHMGKEYHQFSTLAMDDFCEGRDIRDLISDKRKAEGEENRKMLVPIVDTVVTLAKQNIAFRGDRCEAGCVNPEGLDPVDNDGNFRAILRLRIRSGDQTLQKHCETSKRNATMMSPDIQNEILKTVKNIIVRDIIKRLDGAVAWSILADDTSDRSKNELTAICLRYVLQDQKGQWTIREDPIQILDLIPQIRKSIAGTTNEEVKMSGENIGRVLLSAVKALGLDLAKCVGQGYDGCSTMSSQRKGVAATFKTEADLAEYYHCVMHKLNLSAASVIKDANIQFAHAAVKKISKFFNASPKRVELLKKLIEDADDSRITRKKLMGLCETRFLERHMAVSTLRNLLPFVLKTLQVIQGWENSEAKLSAHNLECMMERQQFVSSLVMLEHITGVLKPLTEKLQRVDLDIASCIEMTQGLISQLSEMKGEEYWNRVFEEIKLLAQRIGILVTVPRKRTVNQYARIDSQDPSDHYALIWKACLTDVIEDMKLRFDSDKEHLATLEKLIPSKVRHAEGLSSLSITEKLLGRYGKLLSDHDFIDTEREVDRWLKKWFGAHEPPQTAIAALSHTTNFPCVRKLLIILCSLPVSTAEPERVFSKVERTKTAIRSTMTIDRLESLVLIQTHRETIPSTKIIINEFCQKNRRINFG
ncbi:hypothetical protein ACHWQZ_G017922 [Mnemiopsis leidyi]